MKQSKSTNLFLRYSCFDVACENSPVVALYQVGGLGNSVRKSYFHHVRYVHIRRVCYLGYSFLSAGGHFDLVSLRLPNSDLFSSPKNKLLSADVRNSACSLFFSLYCKFRNSDGIFDLQRFGKHLRNGTSMDLIFFVLPNPLEFFGTNEFNHLLHISFAIVDDDC